MARVQTPNEVGDTLLTDSTQPLPVERNVRRYRRTQNMRQGSFRAHLTPAATFKSDYGTESTTYALWSSRSRAFVKLRRNPAGLQGY